MVKMSSERKKMKSKTDLGLVLNHSNQSVWKNLTNGLCAGANAAASRIDRAFSETDPLSEIVWSPDEGFSLKCLDSNTSLFRDVEPSNMVLALVQGVVEPVDDVFVEPIAVICRKNEVSSTDTPSRNHPTSDSVVIVSDHEACEEQDTGPSCSKEKMTTARGTPSLPNGQKENLMNNSGNTCAQANIGTATNSELKGNKSYIVSGQVDRRSDGNLLLQADEPEQNPSLRKHCNAGVNAGVTNQMVEIEDGFYTKVVHIAECERSGALGKNFISSGISLLRKPEPTVENDLQTLNFEANSAPASRIIVSKYNEDKKSQINEMMLLRNKNIPSLHSPCGSTIHKTRNEGDESSSDVDSNVRFHSTEFVLSGRKRCKQEVMIGSKKIKKQTQETSCCYVNRESSFMNLVSNMMKGYSLGNLDRCLPWHDDQKLLACYKNQDPELRMSHQVGKASEDIELDIKLHGIDAHPINCCAENNSHYRVNMQSKKFEVSKGRHDAGPSSRPQIRPINFLNNHEHRKDNSDENENCRSLGPSKEKEGMPLHSVYARPNKNNDEKFEPWELYDRKELGDLWITRFSPKSASPLIIFDQLSETCGSEVPSTNCSMVPHFHKHISHQNNCKIEESGDEQFLSETRRLQNCCINTEASAVLVDDRRNIDLVSKHKFNPIKPFPRLRDAEPMVSMFAKRLGAIRQLHQPQL